MATPVNKAAIVEIDYRTPIAQANTGAPFHKNLRSGSMYLVEYTVPNKEPL